MNLKNVTSGLGKKNKDEGKFIKLARKKAFQKKEEQKENFYIRPLAIKSMKAVNLI